jgi:transporter family protein
MLPLHPLLALLLVFSWEANLLTAYPLGAARLKNRVSGQGRLQSTLSPSIERFAPRNVVTARRMFPKSFHPALRTVCRTPARFETLHPFLIRGGAALTTKSSYWILPALLCATSYALYSLSIKKAATHSMDPILGGVLLQCVAALVGSLLWIYQTTNITTTSSATRSLSRAGIVWSVAAGVAVGMAELLSFVISGQGVPATQSIPVIVGGSILVGTVLGRFWLQETLSRRAWFGVVAIAAGICLVAMEGVGGGALRCIAEREMICFCWITGVHSYKNHGICRHPAYPYWLNLAVEVAPAWRLVG